VQGREGLIRNTKSLVDVGVRHRTAEKHAVPGMHIDAALNHFGRPAITDAIIRIVFEQDQRHLGRAGLPQAKAVAPRSFRQSVAETGCQPLGMLKIGA